MKQKPIYVGKLTNPFASDEKIFLRGNVLEIDNSNIKVKIPKGCDTYSFIRGYAATYIFSEEFSTIILVKGLKNKLATLL